MTDELAKRRLRKEVSKAIVDWPIEKRIASRAMLLMAEKFKDVGADPKVLSFIGSLILDTFTIAAIELRDEMDCIVVTDLAGMSTTQACEWMARRLHEGCSPITQRMIELAEECEERDK